MSAAMAAALLATAGQACPAIILPERTYIQLVTAADLSSKKQAKGDMVALKTSEDVRVGNIVAIPKDTPVTGQISDARATGGLGMSGKLEVRPLYLKLGATYVRLTGRSHEKGTLPAGTVVGLMITPIFSGRSAYIPAGSSLVGIVEKATEIRPVTC